MESLTAFFIVVLTGIFSSTIFKKLHLPWVAALIIGGIIIGPDVLNIYTPNETIEFISEMGLVFLMFMAGLEIKLSTFKKSSKSLFLLAFINGVVPFITGILVAHFFGYKLPSQWLLGTVFVSSSIAVVIPTLETNKLYKLKIGESVMITSIIQDVASLMLLSMFLQETKEAFVPLFLFYPLLIVSLIAMRYLIPKIEEMLTSLALNDDTFQTQTRTTFLVLLGTVIVFQLLGLHPIIGGFFAGAVLSGTITDEVIKGKLRAISYGVFIPTFFVTVGTQTNLEVFFNLGNAFLLTGVVVAVSILSKFISGTVGAKIVGFDMPQSLFFGASSIPQLSTTLAVAYSAKEIGLIPDELSTALVALSIISTLLGPFLMSSFNKRALKAKKNLISSITP